MKRLYILGILMFSYIAVNAQLTQKEIRQINTRAIELITETYPRYCDYSSMSNIDKLPLIFTSDAMVFNDVLPMNKQDEYLEIDGYISRLTDFYERGKLRVMIDVNGLSYLESDGPDYVLICEIDKIIRGNTRQGYDIWDTLKCEATLKCKLDRTEEGRVYADVKISKIKLAEDESFYFVVKPYFKSKKNQKQFIEDSFVVSKGNVIVNTGQTESNGYFIHKSDDINDLGKLYSTNHTLIGKKRLKISEEENEDNLIFVKFRKHPISLGLTAINGISEANEIDNEGTSRITQRIENYSGLRLQLKARMYGDEDGFSLFLRAGGEYGVLNREIFFDSFKEQFKAIDPDGASYLRTVKLSGFSENQNVNLIMPNVGLGISKKLFNSRINIHLDYSRIFVQSFATSLSTDLTFSGYYKDLYGLTIQENGIYDFGDYQINETSQGFTPNGNADLISFGIDVAKNMTTIFKKSVFARRVDVLIGFERRSSLNSFTVKSAQGFNVYSKENITTSSQLLENDQVSFTCLTLGINYKI